MFVLTLGKNGMKRLGAVALAGVALAGAVFAVGGIWKGGDASPAAAQAGEEKPDPTSMKIENTEGLDAFFKAYGMEMDLADTLVDKVKIPRKWDESFSAFNTVVKESGFDLEKYKGRTVEKWMVLCPGRSTGDQKAYGVVLVYKEQPVGAYLVQKPTGEVTGLAMAPEGAAISPEQAAQTAAEFAEDAEAAEETAAQPEENEAEETAVEVDPQPAEENPAEETAAEEAEQPAEETAGEAVDEELFASAGAEPVD